MLFTIMSNHLAFACIDEGFSKYCYNFHIHKLKFIYFGEFVIAHEGLASCRDVSPNMDVEVPKSEAGVISRPIKRGARNKVRRESIGK